MYFHLRFIYSVMYSYNWICHYPSIELGKDLKTRFGFSYLPNLHCSKKSSKGMSKLQMIHKTVGLKFTKKLIIYTQITPRIQTHHFGRIWNAVYVKSMKIVEFRD